MSEPIREFPADEAAALQPEVAAAQAEAAPMRWHGFLVKCMLWIAAAWHLFQAAWILTGKIYYTPAVRDAIYAGTPAMRIIDYVLAAALVAAAAVQLWARSLLAKYKPRGVKCLCGTYILLAAAQFAYALARFLAAGLTPLSIPVIGRMIACIALLLVNRSYYGKRRSAFGPKA